MHAFVVPLNDEYYFASLNNDGGNLLNFGKCYLYRHDKFGNLKMRQALPINGITYVNGFFQTLDKKLLLLGTIYNCDTPDTSVMRAFITKVDTNGSTIFYTALNRSFLPAFLNDGFNCGLQYPDSSYFAFTDSVMYRFSKAGAQMYRSNLGLNNISSCQLLQNGNLLLSAMQGTVNYLVQLNTSGTIMSQYATNGRFSKMLFYNGQKLMGLGSTKKLYKISPNFQLIDSSGFGNLNKVKDFITMNDSVFSVNYNGNTQMLRLSDTSFASVSQSTTNVSRVVQGAICRNKGFLGVLSNCNSDLPFNANNTFVSLNVFNVGSSNTFYDFDVRVSSVTVDSADCSWYNGNYYPKLRAKVWIRNLGPGDLNKVKLNCYTNTPAICGLSYWQKTYSGFSLGPFDSIQVTTDMVNKLYVLGGPMQPTVSVQYCFYTSVPNDENDFKISNDGLCTSFTFTAVNVEGVKENSSDVVTLEIYPNPATDEVSVFSSVDMDEVFLINSLGQVLDKRKPEKREIKIPLKEYSSGIYFLKIRNGNYTGVKKLIRQ